ncbi:Gfo/Idh/MocA family protein [Paenibacillus sp. FA6]|uniref:Gfo/Idh/MocA family protein n=1 Tax=Paenibacillus sp. FA6 TaxID=3413029 RepID=UPI003F65C5A7
MMKVAVVGCGGMGHVHASAYHKMADVELTAVCDIIPERAQDLEQQTGATPYYSIDQMLAEADFDVISVTVPSYLHKEMTIKAAKAGKHVISEKPVSLSLEDTKDMIQCCEENGVRLFVGHVVRFFPEYARMKDFVDQGKIGQVGVVHTKRRGAHPADVAPWFREADKSGGVIIDLMIHDIDYLRWVMGEVKSVYAMAHNDGKLEFAYVTLNFASGAVANLEASWGYPGAFHTGIELAGNLGVIRNDSEKCSSLAIRQMEQQNKASKFVAIPESPGYKTQYELELQHYISCIRSGDEAIVTAHDAYKALEIGLAAVESAKTGKVVSLEANAEGGISK